jgi:hypothetical protein
MLVRPGLDPIGRRRDLRTGGRVGVAGQRYVGRGRTVRQRGGGSCLIARDCLPRSGRGSGSALSRSVGQPYGWLHALVHPVLLRNVACHEVIPR